MFAGLLLAGSLFAMSTMLGPRSAGAGGAPPPSQPSTPPTTPPTTPCQAVDAESMAARIQTRYEGIRDIRADFEQANEAATFGGAPLMSTDPKAGKVVFAKPGKMRWTYLTPEPSVVVSNGDTLWIHDVAAESVTRLSVTAGFLSGAALQFLLGDGRILESFTVTVDSTRCEPGRVHLDLLPKQDATYERLGLIADRETGDVLGTSVLDLFGNSTRIEFQAIEVNLDPPASTFEFEVPEGVELIDYDGAAGA
jgi:outer membrane lipoprotein carrier protein